MVCSEQPWSLEDSLASAPPRDSLLGVIPLHGNVRGCLLLKHACASLAIVLWLALSAAAQIPRLADIPSQIPETKRTALATLRAGLMERRSGLMNGVASHNSQCGVIAENSPQYPGCAAAQASLEKEKNAYITDVKAYNRQVEAALLLASDPNIVDFSDKQGPLVVRPEDLRPPVREGGPIIQPPAERIAELHQRIAVLRQALINLGQARQKPEARAEWEGAIGEASEDLFRDTIRLQTDLVAEYTAGRFEKGLEDANQGIRTAVDRLAGETDPNRREQLHAAIKMMDQQRNEFKQMVGFMKKTDDAGLVVDTADWAAKPGRPMEKSLEGLQSLLQIALSEKKVQQWLSIAPVYGNALKFGSDVTNVAYDLTKGLMSAARLKELNAQDELYAQRVKDLSDRMTSSMKELKDLEKQTQNQQK